MLKTFRRQLISILLVLMLALSVLPLTAGAAEIKGYFADGNIEIRCDDGDLVVVTNGEPDTYTVRAEGYTSGGWCSSDNSTNFCIYIKNVSADLKAKQLTFSYAFSTEDNEPHDMSLNGTLVESDFDRTGLQYNLPYGEEVFLEINSAEGEGVYCTITVSDVSASNIPPVPVTMKASVGGTITGTMVDTTNDNAVVDSGSLIAGDADKEFQFESLTHKLTVTAAAAEGYTFLGFVDENGDAITSNTSITYTELFEATSITAKFFDNSKMLAADDPSVLYQVGTGNMTKYYVADLDDAFEIAANSASNVVVPLQDMTWTTDVTIPKGVTLLIPFDDNYTCYTNEPVVEYVDNVTPTPYRTLTLADGVTLTIEGAVSLSSKLCAKGQWGAYNGCPSGPDGRIHMLGSSKINVKNGGNLYVWGFIYGSGTTQMVEVQSGGTVYECFQIKDWRGGSATSSVYNYAFIFNQYYVQNIEVPLKMYAGATETLYSSVNASSSPYPISVDFIGSDSGMFRLHSGYLIKDYIEDTDRIDYEVYGTADLAPLVISGVPMVGTVSTDEYRLPLNSNMTIAAKNGKVTVTQNLEMLPGCALTVASGATIEIKSGCSVYLFDHDEWVGKKFTGAADLYVVGYSVANGTIEKRLSGDVMNGLVDAKIDVEGTLDVYGYLYTSEHGANITSKRTGVYGAKGGQIILRQSPPTSNATIYECTNGNGAKTAVTFYAAQLHNYQVKTPYTATAGVAAGTSFWFDAEDGMWYTGCLVKYKYEDGLAENNANVFAFEDRLVQGNEATPLTEDPVFAGGAYDSYTFTGWTDEEGNDDWYGEDAGYWPWNEGAVNEVTSYFALFAASETLKSYTLTWNDQDGNELESDTVRYGADYQEGYVNETTDPDAKYEFNGTLPSKSGYGFYTWQYSYTPYGGNEAVTGFVSEDGWPTVTADVTFTPVFRVIRTVYHINRYYNTIANGMNGTYTTSSSYTAATNYGEGVFTVLPALNQKIMNGSTYVLPATLTHQISANPKTYDLTQVAYDFKYSDATFVGWYVTTGGAASTSVKMKPRYDDAEPALAIASYTPEFLYQKYLEGKIILASGTDEERTITIEANTYVFAVYDLRDILYYRNVYYDASGTLVGANHTTTSVPVKYNTVPLNSAHSVKLASKAGTTLVGKSTDYKYTHSTWLGWYVTDINGNSIYKDASGNTVTKPIKSITPEYLYECYENGYYSKKSTTVSFTGSAVAYAIYTNDTRKSYTPLFYDASANTSTTTGIAMKDNAAYDGYTQSVPYGDYPEVPTKLSTTTQVFTPSKYYYGAAKSAPKSSETSLKAVTQTDGKYYIPRAVTVNGTTANYTYSVYYTASTRYYTGTYYNEDGTELAKTGKTQYNKQASIPSAVNNANKVTKASDDEYSYAFKQWRLYQDGEPTATTFTISAQPPAFTQDGMTYVAEYTATPIFAKHSLTANDEVAVNFYLYLPPDKHLNASDLYVDFSWGNNVDDGDNPFTYTDDTLTERGSYYEVTVPVAAKEMNDEITATLRSKSSEDVIYVHTYRASDYLYEVINSDTAELAASLTVDEAKAAELQALCKSMLTYGAAAQEEFDYHTDSLADAALTDGQHDTITTISEDLGAYDATADGDYKLAGTSIDALSLDFYGFSLTLKSKPMYNLYYYNYGDNEWIHPTLAVSDADMAVNMERYPEGKFYRFDIMNIAPAKMLNDITLTIDGNELKLNPASYMYYIMNADGTDGTDSEKCVIANLYNYSQKASAYFATNN